MDLNNRDMEAVERFIDKYGLTSVLSGIADICAEKSMHIQESYSDDQLAAAWERASTKVGSCLRWIYQELGL